MLHSKRQQNGRRGLILFRCSAMFDTRLSYQDPLQRTSGTASWLRLNAIKISPFPSSWVLTEQLVARIHSSVRSTQQVRCWKALGSHARIRLPAQAPGEKCGVIPVSILASSIVRYESVRFMRGAELEHRHTQPGNSHHLMRTVLRSVLPTTSAV
jgi:hypothetical protein